MQDRRGFTLVELVVTMAISALVAASIFLLLDGGLRVHESGERNAGAIDAMANVVFLLRGDVARSATVSYVASDSLRLDLPDGSRVGYGVHARDGGAFLMRWADDGSGWRARPARPVALLRDRDSDLARLDFHAAGSAVEVDLATAGASLQFLARPWSEP